MENKNFQNQVAIISGAGKGIGFAIARQLAMQGAKVILNDIDNELAQSASKKIVDEGGICESFSGDISDMLVIEGIVVQTLYLESM